MTELRVACDGDTLAWRRLDWRGRELAAGRLPVACRDAAGLLEALRADVLPQAGRGDRLQLVLGSLFIRLALLEWPSRRLSAAESQALLRARWAERLDDPDRWSLRVERRGDVRLSVAIPRDLLDGLEALAGDAGLRLGSCLPALAVLAARADAAEAAELRLDEGPRRTRAGLAGGRLAWLESRFREVEEPSSGNDAAVWLESA